MKNIKRNEVVKMISDLKAGTIYSVLFTKKDGSERLMNSIKGTSKGVKGEGLRFDASAKQLLPVYDLQLAKASPDAPEKAWRMVNLLTIKELRCNKEHYIIAD